MLHSSMEQTEQNKRGASKVVVISCSSHKTEKETRSHVWYNALKNIDLGIYRLLYISRMGLNIFYCLPIFKNLLLRWNKKYLTWIKCWGPPSIADGRFERVFSQNFFRNRQISSETSKTFSICFQDPNAPLGPLEPTNPTQKQPKQGFSSRKHSPVRQRYHRGWFSGHFDPSADLLAPIVAEK